ncbi:alanine racemase [Frondihabitans sucicola]|uniref:Alanine racemase n=1 Tax=Frondihabitans sucicola TaxID=1268041 RepID=A0ABN6Y0P3_9MICO|nr:LacI family DNA-binding transcriptional regulator [Frondihabitans sucicola]BDZ49561.1 alanine racemase [Frondihabitans sucicola]
MNNRRVTIDDVAGEAGVSRQTVSNYIRGKGRVGQETGERIRDIIERLDYTPHPGASSMRSRRSGQLAYPLSETALTPDNVIVGDFIRALVTQAGNHGYHVLITSNGARGMRDLVRSGRVDGFVFSDMFGSDERLEIVEDTHTPFASFGRVPMGLRQAWVDVDNVVGTHEATEHIIGLGHRHVAFLGHRIAYWDDERREGYLSAIAEHGLIPRVVTVHNDQESMDAAALAFLREPDRPTAIVCSSDSLALSVYRAAEKLGLTVGGDISVSGFDSSVIGRSLVPSLTSMRVPVDRIAELVVERFVAELHDPGADVEGELVTPELRPAASTAPPVRRRAL